MPRRALRRMHGLVVPALRIDGVDAKRLKLAVFVLAADSIDHVAILVVIKSPHRGREHDHRHAAVSEDQQFHFAVQPRRKPFMIFAIHSLRRARSRFVCTRLTGISVCFLSSIRSWKLDLNHGMTSLILWMFTRYERWTRQNMSGSRFDCSSSIVR